MERPFDPWNCTLPKPPNDARRLVANFETYKKAKAECDLRVDQLKQAGSNEARQLARDLVACAAGDGHCLSPACPLCVGRTRLWLTEQMLRLWPANVELELWTVIPAAYVAPPGGLHTQSPITLQDALRQQLSRAGIAGPIVGGIDGEYDEGRGVWQPHPHLIIPATLNRDIWKLARRSYPRAPGVYKPALPRRVKHRPEAFSYVYKSYWPERVWWQTSDGSAKSRHRRLGEERHVEWLLWRDQFELTDFLFLRGVRRRGCRLELTATTERPHMTT
jgi:hypothetical protein